ncbi:copper amine oxidase N-terminal domain-containing protein [Paenibacillus sp. ACRRX]|uniref:stalk domain-containing protein n=1 Tax=Paenibacillus sp. ACRRX TaxID=2918206 RepID=UPI001EF3F70F|nr:stalk domain-containing protein [Paenibacillus sp. ACRRX]MCG7409561.1 copper amine oxidase N-terminal domain-containing protein [Paenibacillus sp. ACRRX]
MKKIMYSACIFLVGLLMAAVVQAQGAIKVSLNDTTVEFKNSPIMRNGTVMVPFRELFDSMGLIINYDAKTKNIRGRQNEGSITIISLYVGEKMAYVNDKPVDLYHLCV